MKYYIKKETIVLAQQYTKKREMLELGAKEQDNTILYISFPNGDINLYPGDYVILKDGVIIGIVSKAVFELMYDEFKGIRLLKKIKGGL